jgi:hypothetical protein
MERMNQRGERIRRHRAALGATANASEAAA